MHRFAALLAKVATPAFAAAAVLGSGAAVAVPSIVASVNSAPVTSVAMYHGPSPNMYHG